MRIDKFLWAVRLFKTRSLSAKACQDENIKLNSKTVKGSKIIQVNDEFLVKSNPIWRSFKILSIPKSRVSAKLVNELIVETTSSFDIDLLKNIEKINHDNKMLGIKGRPTKKQRRDLDNLFN